MKQLGLIVFVGLFSLSALFASSVKAAVSDTPISNFPSTNGNINRIIAGPDNTVLIGGDFSMVGTYSGHAIPLSTSTGATVGTFPQVSGRVRSVISDGSGGWYVGGSFTQIGTTAINRLAHINSDGTLDTTWNPGVDDGAVYSIVKSGSTIYVGGSFTAVNNGTTRNYVAAFTTSSSTTTSFNPNFGALVRSLAISSDGSILYAGGDFTSVNGATTRNRLAAITTSNSTAVVGFNPNASSNVNDIFLSSDDTILYVAGDFQTVNGATTRNRAAAFTISNGTANSFNPNLNATGNAITVSGSTAYIGGLFSTVNGGTSRNKLAAVATTNGTATSWDAGIVQSVPLYGFENTTIQDILVSGSTVYVAGEFDKVNTSTSRRGLAALATSDATATSWDPNPDTTIDSLAISGSTLYVGGQVSIVGGAARTSLAQIDLDDYSVTSWNPFLTVNFSWNPKVYGIAYSGTTAYVVGNFDRSGDTSTTRNNAAAFSLTDSSLSSWDPNITKDQAVYDIAISGSKAYVVGSFTAANGGTTRNNAAAFNLTNGTLDSSWNPNFNSYVFDAIISGSTLYAGGFFTTVNGSTNRYNLAATNLTDGTATSWNPDIDQNGYWDDMELSGSTMYVVGFFETVNGSTPRTHLAGFNLTDGTATSFNSTIDADTYYLATNGSQMFIQGDFTEVNGAARNSWAGIHLSDNTILSWNPTTLDYGTGEMTIVGSTLFIGGDRTTVATGQTGILAFTGVEEDSASPSPTPSSSSNSNSSSSSDSSSSNSTGSCTNFAPQGVPDLFEIDARNKSATVFFAPVLTASDYFIRYGQNTSTDQYGTSISPVNNQGVQSFTINELKPNTVYSFQIRGGRGCATGEWSRVLTIRTTSSTVQLQKFYTYSIVGQKVLSNSNIKKLPLKTSSLKTAAPTPAPIIAPELPSQTTQPRAMNAPKPSTAPSTTSEPIPWWQKVINWFN